MLCWLNVIPMLVVSFLNNDVYSVYTYQVMIVYSYHML